MKNKTALYVILIALMAIGLAGILSFLNEETNTGPGQFDTLATCIKEKGATFYGAFWCPHCKDQKKIFGNSAKLLPYVECSTSNAAGQLQICIDKKIESYPTWEFADGSRVTGAISPQDLATKTGCEIPTTTPAK